MAETREGTRATQGRRDERAGQPEDLDRRGPLPGQLRNARDGVARGLRALYGDPADEPVPDAMTELLRRLG